MNNAYEKPIFFAHIETRPNKVAQLYIHKGKMAKEQLTENGFDVIFHSNLSQLEQHIIITEQDFIAYNPELLIYQIGRYYASKMHLYGKGADALGYNPEIIMDFENENIPVTDYIVKPSDNNRPEGNISEIFVADNGSYTKIAPINNKYSAYYIQTNLSEICRSKKGETYALHN